MTRIRRAAIALAGIALVPFGTPAAAGEGSSLAVCAPDPSPPEYYAIPLVTTGRVPGTGSAAGSADVLFGSTPFGVSLAEDGSYVYDLSIRIRNLPEPRSGRFVAWVTTPTLDRIERLGPLSDDGSLRAPVRWNKFLVVITLEPEPATAARGEDGGLGRAGDAAEDGAGGGAGSNGGRDSDSSRSPSETWSGPIVLRGMSRSGAMHTMAGHGPFQQENCAAYGY